MTGIYMYVHYDPIIRKKVDSVSYIQRYLELNLLKNRHYWDQGKCPH